MRMVRSTRHWLFLTGFVYCWLASSPAWAQDKPAVGELRLLRVLVVLDTSSNLGECLERDE